jgi:hypothetical protein
MDCNLLVSQKTPTGWYDLRNFNDMENVNDLVIKQNGTIAIYTQPGMSSDIELAFRLYPLSLRQQYAWEEGKSLYEMDYGNSIYAQHMGFSQWNLFCPNDFGIAKGKYIMSLRNSFFLDHQTDHADKAWWAEYPTNRINNEHLEVLTIE